MPETPTLNDYIRTLALSLGFSDCGFARTTYLKPDHERFLNALQNGYHAGMTFLERETARRFHPAEIDDSIKSAGVFLMPYYSPQAQVKGSVYRISRYALTEDYHSAILNKLNKIISELKGFFPEAFFQAYTDSGPISEKVWAREAGLGNFGKNALFLTPKGSYFFIGILLTSLELPPGTSFTEDLCNDCDLCIKACPVDALRQPYSLDARKCISYHTIESRKEIPVEVTSRLGGRIFGCDICQEVCPINRSVPKPEPGLRMLPALINLRKEGFESMTEKEFQEIFRDSSMLRLKYDRYCRNLAAARQSLSEA